MSYIDGFIVPISKNKLDEYKTFTREQQALWLEHGALDYREWIADDVKPGKLTSFPQSVQLRDDEVVALSWISYRSRAHRDEVSKKVMEDPRAQHEPSTWPFDGKRVIYGGFAPMLEE